MNKTRGTYDDPFLGLAPIDKLNGPSFIQALANTGQIQSKKVSFQFSHWSAHGFSNNNITIGNNVQDAYAGHLIHNLILAESPWLFNINYQGIEYG